MKAVPFFVCKILIFSFLLVGILEAVELERKLEWSATPNAKGYVLRLKTPEGEKEFNLNSNSISLKLEPGEYEVQVAGKNVFGKPGKFSSWKKLEILENQNSKINFNTIAEQQQSKSDSNSQIDSKSDSNSGSQNSSSGFGKNQFPFYQKLIPGFVQYKLGNTKTAYFYFLAFPALGYLGYAEKLRGDRIAENPWNNPSFLIPIFFNRTDLEKTVVINNRNEEKKKYDQAQLNQGYVGLGIFMLYFAHLTDVFLFDGKGIFQYSSSFQSRDSFVNSNRIFNSPHSPSTSELFHTLFFQIQVDL